MAVMIDADRVLALNSLVRSLFVERRQKADVDVTELKSAIDAADAWIDDNAASFNLALPVALRTRLTLVQKTLLLCYVALRRADVI